MWFFIKNNPDKLLNEFRKTNKKEIQNKIIDRLCELNAGSQLSELIDKGYNDIIAPLLIELFKSDTEELVRLFGKNKNSNKLIISKLIELNATDQLKSLLDKGSNGIIVPVLIDYYKSDRVELINLFGKYKNSNKQIINNLIELNAVNELKSLLDNGYNEEIVHPLVVLYQNDPKQLIELFDKDKQMNIVIIDYLISLKAVIYLENLLDKGYNDQIVSTLIELSKDNAEILFKLLNKDKNSNERIIKLLIELKAETILFDLINSEFYMTIIPFFISSYQNDPSKLIKLLGKDKEFDIAIIERLIELKAENELKNLLGKGYNQIIIPFFIKINKDHPEKLIELFGYDKISNELITDLLIKNKAEKELLSLVGKAFDNKIIQFLIDFNKDNHKKLFELFGKNKITDEIIFNRLIVLKAKSELKKLVDSEYKLDILSHQSDLEIFTKDEILRILKAELFNKISKPNSSLEEVFLELLVFYSNLLNISSFNTILVNYHQNIFEYGLFNNCLGALLITFLLDSKKYKQNITEVQKKFRIVEDMDSSIDEIKKNYSNKIAALTSKEEVERQLDCRNVEINKLLEKSKVDLAINLYANLERKIAVNNFAQIEGNKIELINFSNIKIVDNTTNEITKLEQSLKQEIYNLNDSNQIMKAKEKFSKECNKLISKNDFIFTVNLLNKNELNNKKNIELLGNILINTTDIGLKKVILLASSISDNKYWLDYIYKIQFNDEIKWHIIDAIRNKFASSNIVYFLNEIEMNFKEVGTYRHNNFVTSLAFSPDGKYLASGSSDCTVKLVQISNFKEVGTYRHNNHVTSVAFSPDGKYIASGSRDDTVKLVQISNFKEVGTYRHNNDVTSVAFSPDGKYLASGSSDCTVKLVQISNFKEVGTYRHNNDVNSVAFSPDGKYLASGSRDYTVKLVQISNFKEVGTYSHNSHVNSVALSPDGKYLASGSIDYTVKLVQISNFKEVDTYRHNNFVTSVAFSPDGKYLASGSSDCTVKLVQISNFKEVGTYRHNNHVISVVFSPDGKYIVSGSRDNTVKLVQIRFGDINLFEHLFYLYHSTGIEDIKHLKEALQNLNNLSGDLRGPVEKVIENIIERAGKESNTIEITENGNSNSKDIEVKY
ncbi:MAG: WD40 repeat domain-containing protein [Candidatus Delongbacteria bacterium]|jgi:WD40 repeat protein|nr:WD40 repeat domain-containing protein [Candidatus Delongbacteria bacterium]